MCIRDRRQRFLIVGDALILHRDVRVQFMELFGVPEESLPYWLQDQNINNIALVATSVWRYMGCLLYTSRTGRP